MTIYAIRSARFGDLWDVTTTTPSTIWTNNADVVIEEHPDATADELARVEELNDWLHANYNAGAHWIVETTDDARHILELRSMTAGQYRVALERQWRSMDDYALEIRNA
jgi:hypothetical protein